MSHVHFIGISGKAMAPVAKMFLDLGWKVSGSDKGFFPPMSTYLQQFPEIDFYPGFHPEKMGEPDLVVHGTMSEKNVEMIHAKESGVRMMAYPQALEEFVIKENSIVAVGTYGKTTLSSLLTWMLETGGLNPSYMSAGVQQMLKDGVRSTKSDWSVVEGDEYPFDLANPVAKFFFYHPTHLVLTAAEWDHQDVFKTEADFVAPFKKVVSEMKPDSLIVASAHGKNVPEVLEKAACKVVTYEGVGFEGESDYKVANLQRNGVTTTFDVVSKDGAFSETFETTLIGNHMIENITAAVALCNEAKIISVGDMQKAVASFKTVHSRLEVRGETKNGAIVIDDLAHSSTKARVSISALRHWFPEANLTVIYEPNIGNRTNESLPGYAHAFDLAHELVIPRLSVIKKKAGDYRLSGEELANNIQETQPNTTYIEDDDALVAHVTKNAQKGDVIAFMGGHGFRGMIDQVLEN